MTRQTMLYRAADKPNAELGGRKLTYKVFDDEDVAEAEEGGWFRSPDDAEFGVEPADPLLKLLDEKTDVVVANVPALTAEEVAKLLSAEKNGKTRKGVLAALEAAAEALKGANNDPGA